MELEKFILSEAAWIQKKTNMVYTHSRVDISYNLKENYASNKDCSRGMLESPGDATIEYIF